MLDLFAKSSVRGNLFSRKNLSDIKGICDGSGTGEWIINYDQILWTSGGMIFFMSILWQPYQWHQSIWNVAQHCFNIELGKFPSKETARQEQNMLLGVAALPQTLLDSFKSQITCRPLVYTVNHHEQNMFAIKPINNDFLSDVKSWHNKSINWLPGK